jgi:hypothetical protein
MVNPVHSNSLSTIQRAEEIAYSSRERPFQSQDLAIEQDLRHLRFEPSISTLPHPKSIAEILIQITDVTEDIKRTLLKSDIDHQRGLSEDMTESQKKFHELLKRKRENATTLAEYGYFERMMNGFLSVFSIGVGTFMTMTMAPPLAIGGTFLIGSGAMTLASLAMESFGVDESITKPIQLAGLGIGATATILAGYLNPSLYQNAVFAALEGSKTIFSGVSKIAIGMVEKTSSEIEADLADQKTQEELIRLAFEKVIQEVSQMTKKLNVSEEASRMIRQQEELKYQYINSVHTQG